MYIFNYHQTADVNRLEVINLCNGKIAAIFETQRQGKSRFFRQIRSFLYREFNYRKGAAVSVNFAPVMPGRYN